MNQFIIGFIMGTLSICLGYLICYLMFRGELIKSKRAVEALKNIWAEFEKDPVHADEQTNRMAKIVDEALTRIEGKNG